MEPGERLARLPRWLRTFGRKVRGIFGLGFFGGLAAGVGGAVLIVVVSLVRAGFPADPVFWRFIGQSAWSAGIGFFAAGSMVTMTFATALAITAHDRALRDLPLWRLGLLGTAVAGVIPGAIVLAMGGWGTFVAQLSGIANFSAIFAAFGGALTTGLVAVAKHADGRELAADSERESLPGTADPAWRRAPRGSRPGRNDAPRGTEVRTRAPRRGEARRTPRSPRARTSASSPPLRGRR